MVDAAESHSTLDTMDIVCETLQAKLRTKELSSGTSHIQLDGDLLTPCHLQCGKGIRQELEDENLLPIPAPVKVYSLIS